MVDGTDQAVTHGRTDATERTVTDAAHLDRDVLAALLADLPAAMRDTVLVQFEADTRQRMTQIREGRTQGDPKAIGAAAHVLTSLLGTFGAMRVSVLSGDIDEQIRSGARIDELDTVPDLLDQTETAIAAVLGFCELEFKTAFVADAAAGDR